MNGIQIDGIQIDTYEDMQAWFCANGWGCKSCGKLYSPDWYQCSGDTYCQCCKNDMDAELVGLAWWQYPHTVNGRSTQRFEYAGDGSFGFEYAAQQRQEHERIYGY